MSSDLVFTRLLSEGRRNQIRRIMSRRLDKATYRDGYGILAWRVGSFDAATIEGVKDFAPGLLELRQACCRSCVHFDAYEYMGETRTMCNAAEKPNCHECHTQILHNERPCPKDLLPIEVDSSASD
jgi:hypothetical protein